MAQLKYKESIINVSDGSTVLDTLLDLGHEIPNNCRAGACQSCLMQVTKGKVPAQAQKGLKDSYKAKGFFLACSCEPEEDIDIQLPDSKQLKVSATVTRMGNLSQDVIELEIKTEETFVFRAGQYVTLWRDDSLGRSYSIANLPQADGKLRFHIRLIANGKFSSWVHNELQLGDVVYVQGPGGDCFYTSDNPEQNLLLVGIGTGLAPLYGIIHDALEQGHKGEIQLIHGALEPSGLYLTKELTKLSHKHSNLKYQPCALRTDEKTSSAIQEGDIIDVTMQTVPEPNGCKTFLCGDESIVKALRKRIFLAGANMNDIYADEFLSSANN